MITSIRIDKHNPEKQILTQARDVLAAGGLVIVPTETVYGIACDPTVPGAMEKLMAAKGRDGNKPIARLAADGAQVQAAASSWTVGAEALAKAWWPGPLTLILQTDEGWTGYRVPDHRVAIELAKQCGGSLALTSANLSGEPDTKTAVEARAAGLAGLGLDLGPLGTGAIPRARV